MISRNCILKSSFGTSEPNHNTFKCMISWIIRLLVFQEREISSSSFSLLDVSLLFPPFSTQSDGKLKINPRCNKSATFSGQNNLYWLARQPGQYHTYREQWKKVNSFQFLRSMFGFSFTYKQWSGSQICVVIVIERCSSETTEIGPICHYFGQCSGSSGGWRRWCLILAPQS